MDNRELQYLRTQINYQAHIDIALGEIEIDNFKQEHEQEQEHEHFPTQGLASFL